MEEKRDALSVKQQVVDLAVAEGVRAAVGAGCLSGLGVFAAHKYSPWFNKSLGISGKVGTVMLAITGSFFLFSELVLIDAQRHPQAYGFMDTPALAAAPTDAAKPDAEKREKDEGLGMIHIKPRYVYATVANHLYDHPFQMLVALSTPIIGGFFYTEMQKPGLKLSQRIIHTRVQGQASVILILALTMGFREWMTKNGGRIPLDEDDA
ncbi:hypothetical protein NSK_007357 [Nannochloropsis salina CCMP1776]|uniref:HIG1 domain-containing protein n=1 Tax=Nannochloropsis salina CCMP1776 TaxID=1027361 RepID=A0A4D9CRH9_9STRA|nr:hypothetical protein NSK_007357 [Nannochloropsis salina CCMP1776]|eukprot:TFJ81396.1 hypothetical protein NSK_007357 [Nannochloropsis salina CCMP1776]